MKKKKRNQAWLKPGSLKKKDLHNEQLHEDKQRKRQPQIKIVNLDNTQDTADKNNPDL